MPVVVGIAGEGDLEAILQANQPLHRIGRGWVHADLAIPVHGHEPERRVDGVAHDREIQSVARSDRPPVVDARSAERVDSHADLRSANGVHVDHVGEVGDVGVEIVVPVRRGSTERPVEGDPLHPSKGILEVLVCLRLDPRGDGGFRRPAVGWIVFEPAVVRRIVGWRDDDAIGEGLVAPAVVCEDRVGDRGSRRVFIPVCEHDVDAVGGEHLERSDERRHGEGMRVHAQKQRAVDPLLPPVKADGLRDGENVAFVEGLVECAAAMSRGSEGDALLRDGGVGLLRVVGRDESGHVDQHRRFGWPSRERACVHGPVLGRTVSPRPSPSMPFDFGAR